MYVTVDTVILIHSTRMYVTADTFIFLDSNNSGLDKNLFMK